MYLLDADLVCALRDARSGSVDPGVLTWAAGVARDRLFLSVVTLHQLEERAAEAHRADRANGARWRAWLDDHLMSAFDTRVLPLTAAVVRRSVAIDLPDRGDALLAATALEGGLTLTTLRPRAWRGAKVKLFDPTGYQPQAAVDDWRQAARAGPAWVKNLFVRS